MPRRRQGRRRRGARRAAPPKGTCRVQPNASPAARQPHRSDGHPGGAPAARGHGVAAVIVFRGRGVKAAARRRLTRSSDVIGHGPIRFWGRPRIMLDRRQFGVDPTRLLEARGLTVGVATSGVRIPRPGLRIHGARATVTMAMQDGEYSWHSPCSPDPPTS
jgi:hypothetical protein